MVIRALLSESGLPRLDGEVLLAHVLGIPREKLLFMYKDPVSPEVETAFGVLAKKRLLGMPVAYLVGEKEFYSLPFFVTPDVLIPRPDTELLVQWAIPHAQGKRVLDLCCGTGCIGISVAVHSTPKSLTLWDISHPALAVATKNAVRHSITANFIEGDILQAPIDGTYDLILSNPPYIETGVVPTLEKDVEAFEPHLALDGGGDGLRFYPVIIEKAFSALSGGGWLGLEIGYTQGEAVSKMMAARFSRVEVLSDLAGNPRVVVGQKHI